jgi:hypothetical protein
MMVIDPMHNILLGELCSYLRSHMFSKSSTGIIKTQWLNGWIDTKVLHEYTSTKKVLHELDQVHAYLKVVRISILDTHSVFLTINSLKCLHGSHACLLKLVTQLVVRSALTNGSALDSYMVQLWYVYFNMKFYFY